MNTETLAQYRETLVALQKALKSKRAPKAVQARIEDAMHAVDWLENKK